MLSNSMRLKALAVLFLAMGAGACSNVGYRCPLDPSEKSASPTACAGMHDAWRGAKQGGGGATSVLVDDEGRQVAPEARKDAPKHPVTGQVGAAEPYRAPTTEPAFIPPKVFQVWLPATDADGIVHDGHHAWFATPGKWRYGTRTESRKGTTPASVDLFRPGMPNERAQGKIVTPPAVTPSPEQQPKQIDNKTALQNLSAAAAAAQNKSGQPAVTAPAASLGD